MGIHAVITESRPQGMHPLGAPIVANHKNTSLASDTYNRPGGCWAHRLMMRHCLWRHPLAEIAPHVMAVGLLVLDKSVGAQTGLQHLCWKGLLASEWQAF
ncbi:hypothetical protein V6Z93_000047 [Aspergillus fumigatus]